MKLILLFLSLLYGDPEIYYVSNIHCTVKHARTGKTVILGDSVHINDAFIFASPNDQFYVMSPEKGTYNVIPKKPLARSKPNEIWAVLSENMLPATRPIILASRTGMLNDPGELGAWLKSDRTGPEHKMLIIGKELIALNKDGFPQRSDRYFYVQYHYKGEEINKPLAFVEPKRKSDTLFLQLDNSIFRKDNKTLDASLVENMQLLYYDVKRELSAPVCSVQLLVAQEKQLLAEMKLVRKYALKRYAGQPDNEEKVFAEVYSHVATCYGTPELRKIHALYSTIR